MNDLSCFKQSNLLHSQERMSRYQPGGFHPVKLGDTFNGGRYEVYHKLGWGGFSTVWLAKDNSAKRWVSLKITAAKDANVSRELTVHQKLRQARATNGVVQLLDSFVHKGPNGNHQCLVFDLLGPSVETVVLDYAETGEHLEAETIIRITRQFLQALSAMHRAGYAHGDFGLANMAFTTAQLATSPDPGELFDVIGRPETEKLVRLDGKPLAPGMPEQLIKKAGWDDWIDEDDEDVRLIDLGEAFPIGAPPAKLAQPGGLQAPEVIFTGKFDHRVDLWRAGCTIYSLVTGSRPFQYLGDMDVVVAQMIHFVEELPAEWQPQWERMKQTAGRKWEDIPDRMPAQSTLEERFARHAKDPSLRPLLSIIKGLVRFRPEDRISADDALALLDGKKPTPKPKTTTTSAATSTPSKVTAKPKASGATSTPTATSTPSKATPKPKATTTPKATSTPGATSTPSKATPKPKATTTPGATSTASKAAPTQKTTEKPTTKPTATQTGGIARR
ncbi:kinase-like domain-containing protein [Chaetomium sp. MPI-CAGE-AT-0009]|nr:kinase-like domain-containing protein [Chaetomium sp. MPI-CAGE-AT-0009]